MKKRHALFTALLAMACLPACSSPKEEQPKAEEPAANSAPALPSPAAQATPADSTLKMVDLKVGKGDEAKAGDTVSVNYTGWLYENGKRSTKFDSSIGGDPFDMTIGQTAVIPGWTKGLVGMKVGGKRQLIIPPDMGYGERGAGGVIPPNATLEFEIDMLKLSKAK